MWDTTLRGIECRCLFTYCFMWRSKFVVEGVSQITAICVVEQTIISSKKLKEAGVWEYGKSRRLIAQRINCLGE